MCAFAALWEGMAAWEGEEAGTGIRAHIDWTKWNQQGVPFFGGRGEGLGARGEGEGRGRGRVWAL